MSKRSLDKLLRAGQLLSNLAYNISQPAVSLDDHTRRAASQCLEAWDTARREHRAALALARKRKPGARGAASLSPQGRPVPAQLDPFTLDAVADALFADAVNTTPPASTALMRAATNFRDSARAIERKAKPARPGKRSKR